MRASPARLLTVVVLLAGAALTAQAAAPPAAGAPPRVPDAARLVAATDWQVALAYAPTQSAVTYQQWLLSRAGGGEALLFVGVTRRPQSIYRWSGELGYLGEGYLVDSAQTLGVEAAAGRGRIAVVRVRRGARVRLLASAVLRPDGVVPRGDDSPLGLARDALGRSGPFYAVRVGMPESAGRGDQRAAAVALLTAVLDRLRR